MSRSPNLSQRARRRASRVSLRTLQRVASVVGETAAGEPIVEVGSVRLVLPHDAPYLHRLTPCSRCATETCGQRVMNAAQLHQRVSDLLCDGCARLPTAGAGTGEQEQEHVEEEPTSAQAAEPAPQPFDVTSAKPASPQGPSGPSAWEAPPEPAYPPAPSSDQRWRGLAPELADAVAGVIDERIGGLAALLAHRLDEGFRGLASGLTRGLDERDRRVVAQVEDALAAQLGTDMAGRLAETERKVVAEVETAIARRLDEQGQAFAAGPEAVTGQVAADVARQLATMQPELVTLVDVALASRLNRHHETLSSELEPALSQLGDLSQAARAISESASVMGTIYATFIDARHELYERLDRVGEEAAEAGMVAAQAIVRRTDERVAASATSLADEVSELKKEMHATRQTVVGLAEAVERLAQQTSEATAARPAKAPATRKRTPRTAPKKTGAN